MTAPVDLSHVEEMAAGNEDIVKGLVDIFISTSDQTIDKMAGLCGDENSENWKSEAHSLKGSALSIGAANFVEICKEAQNNYQLPEQEKLVMLDKIKTEYSVIKDYLQSR